MNDITDSIGCCEREIARILGRRYCVLTGRGATALWIAYNLTAARKVKVVLPAMVCLSPVFSVRYAERTPLFADVCSDDATIDPCSVEHLLKTDSSIGAVVAVHLYGHPAAMEELGRICKKYGVLLIEDLAQAFGGVDASGKMLGTQGDISIVSFGHTKIIDVGVGGALLTDDQVVASRARKLLSELGRRSDNYDVLSDAYMKLYYDVTEAGERDERFYRIFDLFPDLFLSLYLYTATDEWAQKIHSSLENIKDERAHREKISTVYRDVLEGVPGIKFFRPRGRGIPWRYTFRVPADYRDSLLKKIRGSGFDISSWYPSVTEWTPQGRGQGKSSFPVAAQLEKEVVNLWVTNKYTSNRAKELADGIKYHLLQMS